MKSIGIVRKIDELGRIVLPKELRNSYNIYPGDDFEIYIEEEKIVLEKYSKLNLTEKNILNILSQNNILLITNNVIVNTNEKITKEILDIIHERKRTAIKKQITVSDKTIINEGSIIIPIILESNILMTFIIKENETIDNILKVVSNILLNM